MIKPARKLVCDEWPVAKFVNIYKHMQWNELSVCVGGFYSISNLCDWWWGVISVGWSKSWLKPNYRVKFDMCVSYAHIHSHMSHFLLGCFVTYTVHCKSIQTHQPRVSLACIPAHPAQSLPITIVSDQQRTLSVWLLLCLIVCVCVCERALCCAVSSCYWSTPISFANIPSNTNNPIQTHIHTLLPRSSWFRRTRFMRCRTIVWRFIQPAMHDRIKLQSAHHRTETDTNTTLIFYEVVNIYTHSHTHSRTHTNPPTGGNV